MNDSPFTKKMYAEKKWAFVADYARLFILEKYGGVYLDTDMLLVQPLSPLLDVECFLGEEAPGVISAGALGAVPHHPFIVAAKNFYDTHPDELMTIPRIFTKVFNKMHDTSSIRVYTPETFYPFDADHIKKYKGQKLGSHVIGVHLWNYSWGKPLNKFFKKTGLHHYGVRITEKLCIKKILKKIFGFI